MRIGRINHGCFSIYTNNIVTHVVVVGGTCSSYDFEGNEVNDTDCRNGTRKSTEILSLADMSWSDGPEYPYHVTHSKGVTSDQEKYLGYCTGGLENAYGNAEQNNFGENNDIIGLEKSNGRLRWVFVGNMTTPRFLHAAVKAPMSLFPSC